MNLILKISAMLMLTSVLSVLVSKQAKEFSVLLTLCVSVIVSAAIVSYLEPVLGFLRGLSDSAGLDNACLRFVWKVTGIGLLSQIAATVCADTGNHTLEKVLQILTTAVILWMSIPYLEQLIGLLESILGAT